MKKNSKYWKWKNTIIDFDNIKDEKADFGDYWTKKEMIFHYLGCPDDKIHEWYNGGWSCEYNYALSYAKEYGLVEDYIDYEDKIFELKQGIENIIFQLEHNPRTNAETRDKYIIDELKKLLDDDNV